MEGHEERRKINTDSVLTPEPSKNKPDPFAVLTIVLIFAVVGYLMFSIFRSIGVVDLSNLQVFNTIFISILMQAFPFMLIGIFVASAMHVFVPDEFIVKLFPTKAGLGFVTAMFAGLFFPVCECAIVPVMTRLVKKGVALPIAITFMLSAPIINPIVIISTLYAFPNHPEIALLRVVFGLIIALIVGIVLFLFGGSRSVLLSEKEGHTCSCCRDAAQESVCHSHSIDDTEIGLAGKFVTLFVHAGEEFFTVGKYLVLGAFMTSLIQTLVPRSVFVSLGTQNGLSLFIMMATAFLFSACSTSDAFIARSFVDRFSMGAIMGFLVFGPMMDVKNILMLLANFKKSFIAVLLLLIFALNFSVLFFFASIF